MVHKAKHVPKKFGALESTVQGIIKETKVENEELRELPRKDLGTKSLLPFELDGKVLQMMKNIRQAECVVNCDIAIAIAKGIVLANDRNLLKNGGRLNLDLKAKQSNSKAACV